MMANVETTLGMLKKKHEYQLETMQQLLAEVLDAADELASKIGQLDEKISRYELALRNSAEFIIANNIRNYLLSLYDEVERLKARKNQVDGQVDKLNVQLTIELIEKRKAGSLINKQRIRRNKEAEKKNSQRMDDLWLMSLGVNRK